MSEQRWRRIIAQQSRTNVFEVDLVAALIGKPFTLRTVVPAGVRRRSRCVFVLSWVGTARTSHARARAPRVSVLPTSLADGFRRACRPEDVFAEAKGQER